MLHKFLNVHKLKPFSKLVPVPPPKRGLAQAEEESGNSVLKVVHAGGKVECYYMATPAAKILEKYPSFLLARPGIFTHPWDSVVKPDVILTPGEKVFLVPHGTVRKLRHRIRRPPGKDFAVNSLVSESSMDLSTETLSQRKQHFGSAVGESSVIEAASICSALRRKKSDGKKHVTFCDIKKHVTFDVKHKSTQDSSESLKSERGRRRRVGIVTWEPTLATITETHGNDVLKK